MPTRFASQFTQSTPFAPTLFVADSDSEPLLNLSQLIARILFLLLTLTLTLSSYSYSYSYALLVTTVYMDTSYIVTYTISSA